jgi:predicted Zn-dependent peptidase
MKGKQYFIHFLFVLMVFVYLSPQKIQAQIFDSIKNRVKEHTLTNGMKFIVLERKEAPVVSFHVYADVGSANETYGITGISHLLEHMAFKGTKTVGTRDYGSESGMLDSLDALYDRIWHQKSRIHPDTVVLAQTQSEFESLRSKAKELVVNNELIDLFMMQGDRGINAYTSNDATQYTNSLPSNRLEFWMAATSDRFLNPVFREFYMEKDVVMEERRLALETRPIGKLIEDFFAVAFKAHPYHHSVVGHMSDLERMTRQDVKAYFRSYYLPSNLVVGIVGDVKASDVFRQADLYFGRIPSGPKPEPIRTIEPEQWGERRVEIIAKSQPILVVGYHRPSVRHDDDYVFDALSNIIGQGRSSWLYKILVKDKKIAIETGSFNGWPGNKYPNLCAFYAVPAKDHTSEECLEVIDQQIERLKTELVSSDELTKYKRNAKKNYINSLKSNSSMAAMLTGHEVLVGDWRALFDDFDRVEAVSAEDIQRIAQTYLVKKNRTVGEVVPEEGTFE